MGQVVDTAGHDATVADGVRARRRPGRTLWRGVAGATTMWTPLDLLPRIHHFRDPKGQIRWIQGKKSGQRKRWITQKVTAATMPAPGNVSTQAPTMLPATPQRTADSRLVAPTPMIAEVIVCVVEMGAP